MNTSPCALGDEDDMQDMLFEEPCWECDKQDMPVESSSLVLVN